VEIPLNAQEHFGLLSLLLFRSKPQGVWINASNKLPDAQQTIETIMSHFAQKKEDD
jgi:hypothetical protein